VLYYYEKLTIPEIAEVLNLPMTEISQMHASILARLRTETKAVTLTCEPKKPLPSQNFTDCARKVMALANQEAHRLNHEYIGTEHLLLALVQEAKCVGANVLKRLGVTQQKARSEVGKPVPYDPDIPFVISSELSPQTPRVKKVIELAIEEARTLNHNYVGTEHMLLGLLRVTDGVAHQVLTKLGVRYTQVRSEIE
jgi:ATP-dependent Clp protease ATP-binding subunit ClpC